MIHRFRTNRRDFLRLTSAGVLGTAAVMGATSCSALVSDVAANGRDASARGRKPRKVIFFVSDGMSQAVPSLAENLSLLARDGKGTHLAAMLRDSQVAHGHFETYSLNSLVTDSAAASSAWGSGTRIINGALNLLPDGTELRPILPIARDKGFGTGVVTTTTVTHATPAGFIVNHPTRNDEQGIAEKYVGAVDVIMGGGHARLAAEHRVDQRDMYEIFRREGYKVLRNRDELLAWNAEDAKVLGVFSDYHLPYTIDRDNVEAWANATPTLAEMTEKAIASLDKSHPGGWIMQVEGGRIDHAAHDNDAAGALWDQLAFDDAVGVALRYAAENPDTLVIVTSDHGNSNPGLSSYGGRTNEMFDRLALAKRSTYQIQWELRRNKDNAADLADIVDEQLGIELTRPHAEMLSRILNEDYSAIINQQHHNYPGGFNSILTNYNGIGWVGTSHTEDYTMIAAAGPMQERFGHLIRNTDFFRIMSEVIESDYENPSMTREEAFSILGIAAARETVDADGIAHA